MLPLRNLTNDPAQEYLVEGIHDALISELQQAGATIIGRTSVMRYRDTDAPVREIARDADPLDPLVRGLYGMTLLYEHRFEEAVSLLQATLKTSPNDPVALSTLRTAYHLMGRGEDALRIWKTSYQALGNSEGVAALDRGWKEGGYEGALHAAAVAMEERSRHTYVTPWQIGTLYVRADEAGKALDYLDRAFDAHDPNIPYLTVDPIFDFMRDEPRFRTLIARLRLPGAG